MAIPLGFKDFATGEVLTANDVDGFLMQGLWTFASAAARDAAVTAPQEGNACYLKDLAVIQVYNGSTWATQTGGGLTLLSTTALSGSSVTVSSISGSFTNLYIVMKNMVGSVDSTQVYLRLNGITTSLYAYGAVRNLNTTVQGVSSMSDTKWQVIDRLPSTSGVLTTANGAVKIWRYTDTDFVFGEWQTNGSNNVGADFTNSAGTGKFDNTAAITSVTLFPDSGTFTGTLFIYGEK